MSSIKLKITTGPIEFEMVGDVVGLKMPEGITVEYERDGEPQMTEAEAKVAGELMQKHVDEMVASVGKGYWDRKEANAVKHRDHDVTGN